MRVLINIEEIFMEVLHTNDVEEVIFEWLGHKQTMEGGSVMDCCH